MPAAHGWQDAGAVSPDVTENVPAAHAVQEATPVVSALYVPATHAVHTAEVTAAATLP